MATVGQREISWGIPVDSAGSYTRNSYGFFTEPRAGAVGDIGDECGRSCV